MSRVACNPRQHCLLKHCQLPLIGLRVVLGDQKGVSLSTLDTDLEATPVLLVQHAFEDFQPVRSLLLHQSQHEFNGSLSGPVHAGACQCVSIVVLAWAPEGKLQHSL